MLRKQAQTRRETVDVPAGELLDLLGDSYTRDVLTAVIDEPRSATAVAEATSVSKPTAFRRLNRLEEVGLVTRQPTIDPESGRHYNEFGVAFDTLSIALDGMDVTVELDR